MSPQAYLWQLNPNNHENSLVEINHDPEWQSIDQISNQLPVGAYTTFRTYQHDSAIQLIEQYKRLVESCSLSGKKLELDFKFIRSEIRTIIQELNQIPELRIRIAIDLEKNIGDIYLAVEPLRTPSAENIKNGVNLGIKNMQRDNPKAKLSSFLKSSAEIKAHFDPDIQEIVMVDHQVQILEGLSSNFFAIKNGQIWTAEEEVLSGITRSIVLESAQKANIAVIKKGVLLTDLDDCQEFFITSASRSVLAVKKIENYWKGHEVPGPITQTIMTGFNQLLPLKLEKI